MTPFDANRLAIRYHNTWRGGPTTTTLTQHFTPLDLNRLERTLLELTNTCDYPPTIAHIKRHYHSTPEYGWPKPDDTGPPISLTDYLRRHPDDEHLARARERHPSWANQ